MSKQYPGLPLRDPDTGEGIPAYAYYVRLRTYESWRVPVLYGRFPKSVANADNDSERGIFALFVLILFRPYRQITDLFEAIRPELERALTAEAAWGRLFAEYKR